MRAADLAVKCLESEGVERIFGIPGEENLDLVDALLDSDIELVLTKHEEGASLMAAVTGRLTRRPGVCLSTLGPGATNLVTGVAEAFLSGTPLMALTGQVRRDMARYPRKQYIDLIRMFEPISKLSFSLRDSSIIPQTIAGAFSTAMEERPGPVHIEIPEDVMKEETAGEPFASIEPLRAAAGGDDIDSLREMMKTSEHPMIMAGPGVIRQRAENELRRFSREWNIPVAMTWMGAGIVPFDDPLSLHTVGLRTHDHMLEAFRRSDLVILVGFDVLEFQPVFWNVGAEKKVVHVGPVTLDPKEGIMPDLQVVGDLSITLSEIASSSTTKENWTKELREQLHRNMRKVPDGEGGRVKPQLIVREIRDALDREDIAICDVGAHLLWMMKLYPAYKENTLIASNGLIPMGYAVPGAIAAKLQFPGRKVVAACGDGGFMMTSSEIETAIRIGTPFVAVVFNDSGYGLIETRQTRKFGRTHGVKFENPDLVSYAESFGARGYRATSANELAEILKECLKEDVPCIIDVPVDYSENARLTQ